MGAIGGGGVICGCFSVCGRGGGGGGSECLRWHLSAMKTARF